MGMNAPHYYETLQKEFMRLHGLGWTFRQMAGALDISERTVTAWRQELNLPRRPRGRKPRRAQQERRGNSVSKRESEKRL
jgi:hypothetical protein